MDPVTTARNEIEPLLGELIRQLNAEGRATPGRVFRRIRTSLQNARNEQELASPFIALSTSAYVGFELSSNAAVLLRRILDKAEQITNESQPRNVN